MNYYCAGCGEIIRYGFKYLHDPEDGVNYHMDCVPDDTHGLQQRERKD